MLKKLISIVVILALLLLAGKLGLEYRYKQQLDKYVQAASLVAYISYGGVNIGLDGSVNVRNILVRPNNVDLELTAKKVRLFASDRLFLFKGLKIFDNGDLPQAFDINISQLEYDANFGMELDFDNECRFFDSDINMRKLTGGKLISDIDILLNASDKSRAELSANIDTQGVYSIRSTLGFDAFAFSDAKPEVVFQQMLGEGDLPINTLSLDAEYVPRFATKLLSYCAEKMAITPQEYLLQVVGSDQYYQRMGFVPSAQLKEAMQAFSQGGKELSFVARPSKLGKNLRRLRYYQPQDIVKFLNLTGELEGRPLNRLVVSSKVDKNASVSTPESAAKRESKSSQEKVKPQAKAASSRKKRQFAPQSTSTVGKKTYRTVRLSDAKRYVGRHVRIKRRGRLLEGRLASWGERKMVLERRGYGGKTEMPININEVVGLEVLR